MRHSNEAPSHYSKSGNNNLSGYVGLVETV